MTAMTKAKNPQVRYNVMKNFQSSSPKHYDDKNRIKQQAEQLGLESVPISDLAFYSSTLSPRSIKKRASKAQQLMQAV